MWGQIAHYKTAYVQTSLLLSVGLAHVLRIEVPTSPTLCHHAISTLHAFHDNFPAAPQHECYQKQTQNFPSAPVKRM